MRELVAGSRLYAVNQTVATRRFFLQWLKLLDSDPPLMTMRSFLQETDRWLREHRKRRAPISHSNWNEYSGSDAIPLRNEETDTPRIVSRGERVKVRLSSAPAYPIVGKVGNVVITSNVPDGSSEWYDVISYDVGDLHTFHDCSQLWRRDINKVYPHMGFIPNGVQIRIRGGDRQYAGSCNSHITSFAPVRTESWPTLAVSPTQAQVAYARRNALASMYAGNPGTKPNFLRALIELKDVKRSVVGLLHFYEWGRAVVSHGSLWEKTARGMRRVKASSATLSELAGAYLNYVFGLRPTVDDVRTFIRHVTNLGLNAFRPPGQKARPGITIVSNYVVTPSGGLDTWGDWWFWRNNDIRGLYTNYAVDYATVGEGGPGSSAKIVADRLEHIYSGCVFARIRRDNSEYFWNHFGDVGYTWSWPPILTAWELLPWSWLVDWFSDTRESIRLAEREARSYWMRCGFEEPWYAERHDVVRHCHTVSLTHNAEGLYGLKRYKVSGTTWQVSARLWSYWFIRPGPKFLISREFERHPLGYGFPNVESTHTRVTVRAFQISVGMALVLNS